MKVISHRGNLYGPSNKENSPDQIALALKYGLDCEIDIWSKEKKFYLGHDQPTYLIEKKFLENDKLWCHAKNLEALHIMLSNKKINCFWHETDSFTLTSNLFIWTFPGKQITKKSIIVDNSKNWKNQNYNCYGVCTDYPLT